MTGQNISGFCPILFWDLHLPVLQCFLPFSSLIDSTLDVDCSSHIFVCTSCLLVQVTTSSFDAAFSIDTAGAIYYVITNLSSSSVSVQPGSAVLASGGFGELTPAPTAESDYSSEPVTIEGGDTTIEVDFPTGRRLTGQSDDTASDAGTDMRVTPWHSGVSMGSSTSAVSGAALPQNWQDSVTHRYVFWSVCTYRRVSAHTIVKIARATSPARCK